VERGDSIDVLYVDLVKAFNTISTRRLVHKVADHGIKGKLPRWIEALLTDTDAVTFAITTARSTLLCWREKDKYLVSPLFVFLLLKKKLRQK
jgi:hypothetical protein